MQYPATLRALINPYVAEPRVPWTKCVVCGERVPLTVGNEQPTCGEACACKLKKGSQSLYAGVEGRVPSEA